MNLIPPKAPFVPKPVILCKCPASSGKSPREQVVGNSISKFGPPKVTLVTFDTFGNLYSAKISPVLCRKAEAKIKAKTKTVNRNLILLGKPFVVPYVGFNFMILCPS